MTLSDAVCQFPPATGGMPTGVTCYLGHLRSPVPVSDGRACLVCFVKASSMTSYPHAVDDEADWFVGHVAFLKLCVLVNSLDAADVCR